MVNKYFDKKKADEIQRIAEYRRSFEYVFEYITEQMTYYQTGKCDISFLNPSDDVIIKLKQCGLKAYQHTEDIINIFGQPIKSLRTIIEW